MVKVRFRLRIQKYLGFDPWHHSEQFIWETYPIFNFIIVSDTDRGECQLPGTFFGMKNIKFLTKVNVILILENTYSNTLRARTLIAIPRKSTSNFEIYLLLQFLRYQLEFWKIKILNFQNSIFSLPKPSSKNLLDQKFSFGPWNITSKFQVDTSKAVEEDRF